jgi:hypothetical protein
MDFAGVVVRGRGACRLCGHRHAKSAVVVSGEFRRETVRGAGFGVLRK